MEIGLDALIVNINRMLEILNSFVVVIHILIHQATLNINGFVIGQLLHHFWELSESFAIFTRSSEHQTLMEHRADETLVARESLIKRLNCFINQNVFPLKITIFFFGNLVSLTLVG